jgi:hypothetical protein
VTTAAKWAARDVLRGVEALECQRRALGIQECGVKWWQAMHPHAEPEPEPEEEEAAPAVEVEPPDGAPRTDGSVGGGGVGGQWGAVVDGGRRPEARFKHTATLLRDPASGAEVVLVLGGSGSHGVLKYLECPVSKFANSDTCPRPTTGVGYRLAPFLYDLRSRRWRQPYS